MLNPRGALSKFLLKNLKVYKYIMVGIMLTTAGRTPPTIHNKLNTILSIFKIVPRYLVNNKCVKRKTKIFMQ